MGIHKIVIPFSKMFLRLETPEECNAGQKRIVHEMHETCDSVAFYFMKNSFSDTSRKWILPNMIRAEIKRDGRTCFHDIHVIMLQSSIMQ